MWFLVNIGFLLFTRIIIKRQIFFIDYPWGFLYRVSNFFLNILIVYIWWQILNIGRLVLNLIFRMCLFLAGWGH